MASKNISIGPTTQLSNSEVVRTFIFENTSLILPYSTFAKGGYIISIKPIANGIFVVPVENEFINPDDDGIKYPMDTPIIIARKIHKVRKRSRNPSRFLFATGLQLSIDMFFYKIL
jgi:hypothetical protein